MDWIKTHHRALSPLRPFFRDVDVSVPRLYRNRKGFLYVHVPFCTGNCTFCILYRERPTVPYERYVNALLRELRNCHSFKPVVVYFGGGTPTLLPAKGFGEILDEVTSRTSPGEVTVESTVSEFDEEKARALSELGVNRISFGIQTFEGRKRALLGRRSGAEEAFKKLKLAMEYFDVVSVDLLYDLPFGNTLLEDVETVIKLDIDGLSIYPLEHTPLTAKYPHPSVEENLRDFLSAVTFLYEHGYRHLSMNHFTNGRDGFLYSVTFTRPEVPLLGIGPGAGGHVMGHRIFHSPGVGRYLSNPYSVKAVLSGAFDFERFVSRLFEGRLTFDTFRLEDFPSLAIAEERGWVEVRGKTALLTPLGLFWANTLAYLMCLDYVRTRLEAALGEAEVGGEAA
ncbi:hypothetical protein TEU_08400 [Thermococcus eurythermalis]|uniref:Radical SAM core domain-containing protein n=1 Tax=Thermococcus eurythermalis TaxID=1505907 RepID=A0A097QV41_9EURY|nr:radical SAM protein [Thermococcus eurythermalis]AIU70349.1 hypothetical protein TEU_08400 [Thermococcus eurythermalis]